MQKKEWVAMLLAGGEGKRLGVLTKDVAKPAVHFGGKYRIIDFTLSNCSHSGIDTVGVLTQYQPLILNRYLGIGTPWGLDRMEGGMSVLPPYVKKKGGVWYKGTANAIYQNIDFIERYDPEYVLIISGDHIYTMDYDLMLKEHKRNQADATIAVIEVDWSEASRFGMMKLNEEGQIIEFAEKPKKPSSNLASMGVYIFSWKVLRKYLIEDETKELSSNDFGKDLIPAMIKDGIRLYGYAFNDYWKDVGTIESLWEANMDLLSDKSSLDIYNYERRIYSSSSHHSPQYLSPTSKIHNSLINEGTFIEGEVDRSIISYGVHIAADSFIQESVIMPNVIIGKNVQIYRAVIGEGAVIEDGAMVGYKNNKEITVVGSEEVIRIKNNLQEVDKPC